MFMTVGTYKKDMAHLNKSIISKCLYIYYVLICVHGGGIYIYSWRPYICPHKQMLIEVAHALITLTMLQQIMICHRYYWNVSVIITMQEYTFLQCVRMCVCVCVCMRVCMNTCNDPATCLVRFICSCKVTEESHICCYIFLCDWS